MLYDQSPAHPVDRKDAMVEEPPMDEPPSSSSESAPTPDENPSSHKAFWDDHFAQYFSDDDAFNVHAVEHKRDDTMQQEVYDFLKELHAMRLPRRKITALLKRWNTMMTALGINGASCKSAWSLNKLVKSNTPSAQQVYPDAVELCHKDCILFEGPHALRAACPECKTPRSAQSIELTCNVPIRVAM